MNMYRSNYTRNALVPLSDDQIRRVAPSVFATEAHESRSARYAYVPTFDVLNAMRREGFQVVSAIQSRSRIPGKAEFTKHQLRFTHVDAVAKQIGDSITQVVLTNSHDGTSTYMMDDGVFRLICLNGMMVADNASFQTLKIPHTGKIIDRVIEGSFQVLDRSKVVTERIEQFQSLQLSHQEQDIFARAALSLRFDTPEGKAAPVQPAQVLRARRAEDQGNDLWRTFNRVQEGVLRGGIGYTNPAHRTDEGRYVPARYAHTREVKGIDQGSSLNRALWRLAEEMRALKA